jgi:PAS domain S-box-containing protein
MMGLCFDITTQKQAEEKLLQVEAFYKAIIEKASDGVVIIGLNGAFKYISPSTLLLFGYKMEEAKDFHPDDLTYPDDLPMVIQTMGDLIANPLKIATLQYRYKHQDGSWIWIESTFRNLLAEPGIEGIVINFHEITERKEAEMQILKLNQDLERRVKQRTAELESANKELESFSYSVSHDLLAPLRRLKGFINLLRESITSQLTKEEQVYLQFILSSEAEMEKLIEALLSFSRLNISPIRKNRIRSSEMVKQVIRFFDMDINERKITFNVAPLPDVSGDEELIRQVWTNLVSNAIKYTRKKTEAVIEIGSIQEAHVTTFFIKDNGAGFDMDYADKLFGVFQRLHKASDFEGVGIGLANVNRIITRHEGSCHAEGKTGIGATFYFSLPDDQVI